MTTTWPRLLAPLVLLLVAGPVAGQEAWQGIWSHDPAWCSVADRIGSVTPAPVALTASEFLGYENTCTITGVDDAGYGAWRIALECQSEGDTYENVFTVMVRDDAMWLWDGTGTPTPFQRCPQ